MKSNPMRDMSELKGHDSELKVSETDNDSEESFKQRIRRAFLRK